MKRNLLFLLAVLAISFQLGMAQTSVAIRDKTNLNRYAIVTAGGALTVTGGGGGVQFTLGQAIGTGTGTIAHGYTLTNSPTQTTGQVNPLTLNLKGGLHVTLYGSDGTEITSLGNASIGATTDDKSTATDTTATTLISLLKEVSYLLQTGAKVVPATSDGAYGASLTNPPVPITVPLASAPTTAGTPYVGANHDLYVSNPLDPCSSTAQITLPISQAAGATILAGVSAQKIYVCGGVLVAGAAEIVNFVEGTGTVCATGGTALVGSTTAANGLSLAANGGFIIPTGGFRTSTAADGLCLTQNSTSRISGYINYVQK